MQTNIPGIYAAGDVAAATTSDGREHRVRALWPCAAEQGEVAGTNLAGCETSYQGSLNMNVTELFGLVVASMGRFVDTDGKQVWKYGARISVSTGTWGWNAPTTCCRHCNCGFSLPH